MKETKPKTYAWSSLSLTWLVRFEGKWPKISKNDKCCKVDQGFKPSPVMDDQIGDQAADERSQIFPD